MEAAPGQSQGAVARARGVRRDRPLRDGREARRDGAAQPRRRAEPRADRRRGDARQRAEGQGAADPAARARRAARFDPRQGRARRGHLRSRVLDRRSRPAHPTTPIGSTTRRASACSCARRASCASKRRTIRGSRSCSSASSSKDIDEPSRELHVRDAARRRQPLGRARDAPDAPRRARAPITRSTIEALRMFALEWVQRFKDKDRGAKFFDAALKATRVERRLADELGRRGVHAAAPGPRRQGRVDHAARPRRGGASIGCRTAKTSCSSRSRPATSRSTRSTTSRARRSSSRSPRRSSRRTRTCRTSSQLVGADEMPMARGLDAGDAGGAGRRPADERRSRGSAEKAAGARRAAAEAKRGCRQGRRKARGEGRGRREAAAEQARDRPSRSRPPPKAAADKAPRRLRRPPQARQRPQRRLRRRSPCPADLDGAMATAKTRRRRHRQGRRCVEGSHREVPDGAGAAARARARAAQGAVVGAARRRAEGRRGEGGADAGADKAAVLRRARRDVRQAQQR